MTCKSCDMCTQQATGRPAFAVPHANRAAGSFVRAAVGVCCQLGGSFRAAKRSRVAVHPAETSVRDFIRLIELLDTAPWANIVFDVNDRMVRVMCATHLHLIVGKAAFKTCDRPALMRIIDPDAKGLESYGNVVWITNRQQGKTTTLGKFIAALAIHSSVGGHLCNVYSTSLDRANELSKAAKKYVRWVADNHKRHAGVKIITDNSTTFVVDNGIAENKVVARPKNPDTCRGDAPESCFFDEVAFCSEDFWYKFSLPLLQVSNRTATCTSGFFSAFVDLIKKQNADGDNFFYLENHSLSCQACIEIDEAERCTHNLSYVPPWKSLLRFNAMRHLIPKKQEETFRQEVMGVIESRPQVYFPPKLVDAAVQRQRHVLRGVTSPVWVGIDPAGHAVSDMGISAIVYVDGMIVVAGAASVNVAQSDVAGVLALVKVFLRRLREVVGHRAPFVPVVEVNGSEVYAASITKAFAEFAPVYMPFTSDTFPSCIVSGVGVRTTRDTKAMMVHRMYASLTEGRVVFAKEIAHVCKADTTPKSVGVSQQDHITELAAQLKRMRDTEKNEISGKTSGGENDDIAIAFMQSVYWSACVMAALPDVNRACA